MSQWHSDWVNSAGTLRNNDVVITSKRRHCDVITPKWRSFDVMTTLSLCHVFKGGGGGCFGGVFEFTKRAFTIDYQDYFVSLNHESRLGWVSFMASKLACAKKKANCHNALSLTDMWVKNGWLGSLQCNDEDEFVYIIEYNGKKHNIKTSWLGHPAYLILVGSGSLR